MRCLCLALVMLAAGSCGEAGDGTRSVGEIPTELEELLRAAEHHDVDTRREAAANLSIALLKRNRAWRTEPHNWKIRTEEGIRMEVKGVRSSKQTPDLAIANMCAHCMGMLKGGSWQKPPLDGKDPFEEAVARLSRESKDPVVRTILLVGLASSLRVGARDTVVAATSDPHAGVRKSACYLVERCTRTPFGPGGNIHIGSPEEDVGAAGENIRALYRWDRTLGAGWGPMRRGLQTRLAADDKVAVIGEPVKVRLVVRNVSDKPIPLPNKAHPLGHFRLLYDEKYLWPRTDIRDALTSVTVEPGQQVEYWSFILNEHYELLKPGVYTLWLRETDGVLPPRSNRVRLRLQPAKSPRAPVYLGSP